ncbi:MAG TPA: nitronate monooxygenase [Solirubrobacteraceae bacterium]|nr:nitronate monooxygenase [Solirubrobacteraceae bacterium]
MVDPDESCAVRHACREVSRFSVRSLQHPIVQAPMGGGPSTPALAAAVAEAGGLGFLAAGYKTADAVREDVEAVRALTRRPFGVNLFAPPQPVDDPAAVERFAGTLSGEADRYDAPLGAPRHDDDDWAAKLALVAELAVPVVSFTFGCPPRGDVRALQHAGVAVWVTVTRPEEAVEAAAEGADALVVQGAEAGGHRATFDDTSPGDIGLLALLQLVQGVTDLPLIATGGIATGRGVAAVLAAGADAAMLGTAFMLCPEAATAPAHRDAISAPGDTALTRAYTGRTARGIVNRWLREHHADAPSAYPDVHHVTAKVRAAARTAGDADGFHLWAGQAHTLTEPVPAAQLVARLGAEARAALRAATAH